MANECVIDKSSHLLHVCDVDTPVPKMALKVRVDHLIVLGVRVHVYAPRHEEREARDIRETKM